MPIWNILDVDVDSEISFIFSVESHECFKSLRSWLLTHLIPNCSEKPKDYSCDDVNVPMYLNGRKPCGFYAGKP